MPTVLCSLHRTCRFTGGKLDPVQLGACVQDAVIAASSGLSHPVYAHEISILLEIVLDFAVKGALDCLANAARQVDVRRVDHDPLRIILDADDPVERMLLLLRFLL